MTKLLRLWGKEIIDHTPELALQFNSGFVPRFLLVRNYFIDHSSTEEIDLLPRCKWLSTWRLDSPVSIFASSVRSWGKYWLGFVLQIFTIWTRRTISSNLPSSMARVSFSSSQVCLVLSSITASTDLLVKVFACILLTLSEARRMYRHNSLWRLKMHGFC